MTENSESQKVRGTEEDKQAILEDLASDMLLRNTIVRIYMGVIWAISIAVMCYFIFGIYTQYSQNLTTPSSSINLLEEKNVVSPKVVVCNWNQDGSVSNSTPSHNCPICLIQLTSCQNLNTLGDCSLLWEHTPIQTFAGLFDCWTYNGNNMTPIISNTTGYSGSIATVWEMLLEPQTIPPINRAGAQASFFILDGEPTSPQSIYDEVRFASVGLDTFFAVQYIQTLHQESQPQAGIERNSSRYATTVAGVNLLQYTNNTYGYLGISFAFQTLSEEQDIFFDSYTMQNFWGDFSGMIGTVLGLDMIKVCSGIPIIFVAFRYRTLYPLDNHFSGG